MFLETHVMEERKSCYSSSPRKVTSVCSGEPCPCAFSVAVTECMSLGPSVPIFTVQCGTGAAQLPPFLQFSMPQGTHVDPTRGCLGSGIALAHGTVGPADLGIFFVF